MKLTLRITHEEADTTTTTAAPAAASSEEKPLVIRNPRATVANLRAAIAVTLKTMPGSLRMVVAGTELTDDKAALAAAGVADGTSVEVICKKRAREEESAAAAAAAAGAAEGATAAPRHRREGDSSAAAGRRGGRGGLTAMENLIAAAMRGQSGQVHLGDGGSDDDGDDGDDGEGPLGASDLDSMGDDEAFEFGSEGFDDDDDDDGSDLFNALEEGEEEEATPEMQEQAELVAGLIQLPNFESLKARFDADPRAAMGDLQNTNPRLFNLIARHPQFFLDFLNSPDEDSDDDGDESDDGGARPNQPVMAARTAPAPSSLAAGAPAAAASTGAAATPAAPQQRNPTEADTRNIEELMQLGFTREQCTEAYWRHGRNPNRAAGWLFEQGSAGAP